jgi:hypothetical protein
VDLGHGKGPFKHGQALKMYEKLSEKIKNIGTYHK